MSSANSNPPIFPEAEKFNGTNFGTFETLITIAASSRGILGYLQGTIPNPTLHSNATSLNYTPPLLNIPLPDDPTPWYYPFRRGMGHARCLGTHITSL